jgi:hypothetical protein
VRDRKVFVGIVQSVESGVLKMIEAGWLVVKYERNVCRVGRNNVGPPSPCTDSLPGLANSAPGMEKAQK